jgi:hypothetical protein
MGFLIIVALALGGIAFFFGAFLALALFLKSLGHLIKRNWSLAGKLMFLTALSLGILSVCYYLFASQPVEWPWSPTHIPFYLLANYAFVRIMRFQKRWEEEPS